MAPGRTPEAGATAKASVRSHLAESGGPGGSEAGKEQRQGRAWEAEGLHLPGP